MNRHSRFNRGIALAAMLLALAGAYAQGADDHGPSKDKERQLIETLRTAAPSEKALACKHLAIHGTKDAVPELAKLLTDEQLASWARIALEAIPDPSADEALRTALSSLKGRLLIGTINSIGVRRDAGAVDALSGRLGDPDAEVASAAAVALGHVGNAPATKSLRGALGTAPAGVRSAVAEGCILCAERLLSDGHADEAAAIYDEVRKADVPKPRKLEATRGAILARKSNGIPLLLEQLRSPDKSLQQIALGTARELPGRDVAEALAGQLMGMAPTQAALVLHALAERKDASLPSAVLEAAKSGDKQVRIAAIGVIGRLGDAASVPTLLEIATETDSELAQAAKTALGGLSGEKVNAEIASRLPQADGKALALLIELVGQRRIDANGALVKAVDNPDKAIRAAALTALGATATAKELPVLLTQAVSARNADDAQVAGRALREACIRMPQREACAAELAAAMSRSSSDTKASLLEILGAMGGSKALETIVAAVKSNDAELQDTGSRLLGEWMEVDAGPALLDLSKNLKTDKYRSRVLRGYIRLARQFAANDSQRAEMCANALEAAQKPDEQKLVLAVLEQRSNSNDALKVAVKAAQVPALRDDAARTVLAIAQKLAKTGADAQKLVAAAGLDPMKVEIVKAQYGYGDARKDVTKSLQERLGDWPVITLPGGYNDSFGGDPAPGSPKQLTIQYRINGKPGDATFAENSAIVLPMPK